MLCLSPRGPSKSSPSRQGDKLSLREFVQSSEHLLRFRSSTRYRITVSQPRERLEIIRGDGNFFFKFRHRLLVHGFFGIRYATNVVGRKVLWIQLERFRCLLDRLVVLSRQE